MEKLTHLIIDAIERGWFPDWLTRRLSRRLCRQRLGDLQQANVSTAEFARSMRTAPVAPVPEKANEQHYELPAEFFELLLGPRLKYSCCFFENESSTLPEAEIAALTQTCQHAELADGMDILELGCGWGSLTLWMLQQYPAARVTAVSNSRLQRDRILARAEAAGCRERLKVITADMNDFAIDQRFDRVVSVEMFEHMRNYEMLLRRVASWLKPSGKLFVHIFCHRTYTYAFDSEGASNWMGRYFFTGGIMPAFDIFDEFADDLQVSRSWVWDGRHYQRTCNAWLDLLVQRRAAAMQILRQAYGDDEARRWFHRWRLFLIAGAELFGLEQGRQWQVGHYLLEPVRQADETADRPAAAVGTAGAMDQPHVTTGEP
jgi:cyclopropane-fatty-acyl-phospholipid synthase